MALRKITALAMRNGLSAPMSRLKTSNFTFVVLSLQMRNISSLEVTKNISLLSDEKKNCGNRVIGLKVNAPEEKPLVVMLSWLMAKKKHVHKYADIYLKHGFDVLNISISPWQLLWPVKGSQVVAKDLLKFLDVNTAYSPLVLHGFSVGAYLWGEVMVNIASERERYAHVVDRIAGQIWDSAADITEISVGLPVSVFPRNTVLQNALKQYVLYHMKAFDKVATVHYVRSSQMFHTNLVRAPAQIFISKTDPIGTEESNMRVRESWENMGMKISWKCWDKSPHVGHFRAHPKEYTEALNTFLGTLNIPQTSTIARVEEKIKAKL